MLTFIKKNKILLLLVASCIVFYGDFAYNLDRSDFIKLTSLYGILFFLSLKIIQQQKGKFWLLAGIGVLFRFIFIGVIPNLSQDFYRFIWDGRMVIKNINPYLFTPEDFLNNLSAASRLGSMVAQDQYINQAQELYNGMGSLNGSHYSNYPPINQLCFAVAALFAGKSILGSAIVMRVLIILADIGILYFGRKILINLKQNPDKIFWYFLNPFIIIELTGNLHFEGVMLFFLIWALYLLQQKKWMCSAVVLGVSVSVKLIPLLFLPLFFQWFTSTYGAKRGFIKLFLYHLLIVGTVAITFIPFYSSQFVSNFTETIGLWFQNFEFNASVYYVIRWIGFKVVGWNIIETVGKILPLIVILFILLITFLRENKSLKQLITVMLFGISFYFLLSTTIHPWYIAPPLLLSVFTKYKFSIVWSFVVILSYSAYGIDGFSENLWLVTLEYIIVFVYFVWELLQFKKEKTVLVKYS